MISRRKGFGRVRSAICLKGGYCFEIDLASCQNSRRLVTENKERIIDIRKEYNAEKERLWRGKISGMSRGRGTALRQTWLYVRIQEDQ